MKSATIISPHRQSAEGRTHAPLTGQVRGTGVPGNHSSNASDSGTAVLCNITEQSWILHRTHGTFVVAGRSPESVAQGAPMNSIGGPEDFPRDQHVPHIENGHPRGRSDESERTPSYTNSSPHSQNDSELPPALSLPPYALTTIAARTGSIDLGDKRTLEFPISARDIAEDLAREINADGGESSYFGVFVCEGAEPTADELDQARERLESFYRSLVNSADKHWERTHNVIFISDLERRAARELKFEKEWSYEPQQRIDCPACGEKLKPNVAVCKVCGAVLDRAKAAKWGLVSPTEVPAGANVSSAAPTIAPAAGK